MAKKPRQSEHEKQREAEAKAAKAAVSDKPLRANPLAALKEARDALAAQEEAQKKARREAEEKERARLEAIGLSQRAAKAAAARSVASGPGASAVPATTKAPGRYDDVWRPNLDKELFSAAMSGVRPLEPKEGAPRVKPPAHAVPPSPPGKSAARNRRIAAEGGAPLPVRWLPDGRCECARPTASFALAALGRFTATAEDSLDLHGLDAATARTRVEEFVRTRRARGAKVVTVVHGVGKHSPDGSSVLRDAAVAALSEAPGNREVDAFKSADVAPGRPASGALWVALRGPDKR